MSLLQLPPELLHRICGYCELAEIKSARRASTLLAAIGAEYLLSEVEVFFVRESFEKLTRIARSSGVAKGVRALCFQADRLQAFGSRTEWDRKRDRLEVERDAFRAAPTRAEVQALRTTPRGERLLSRWATKAEEAPTKSDMKGLLSAAYEQYTILRQDESRMETDATARESLRTLFKAAPRLDSIVFTVANELRHTTTTNIESFKKTLTHPFGDRDNQTWCIHQLEATLCAAYEAHLELKSLVIATISYRFFGLQAGAAEQIYQVVSKLVDLQVNFNWCYDNDTDEMDYAELSGLLRDVKDARLVRFFSSAGQLHRLKIGGPYSDHGISKLPLIDTVGDTVWPELHTLHLKHFECTQEHLSHLISRHARTLESLHLNEMVISDGNWNDFLESIAGKFPELKEVSLRGEFGCLPRHHGVEYDFDFYDMEGIDPFTKLMQDYVLNRGSLPDLAAVEDD
ncbi:hypothetical protein LTR85_008651 [Meristemomyces frigidus]|nr:hypothetical protein LTR85_008651 [Meristemomyces frigidus]